MSFWAPGRRFSNVHWVAIRYVSDTAALDRISSEGFPKEVSVMTQWCNQCGCWHITRPDGVADGVV